MKFNPDLLDGEQIIVQSVQLRSKRYFNEAIELIEDNIDRIPARFRVSAWYEAFNSARAKGDTELAKKFMLAMDGEDPSAFTAA